MNWAQLLRDFWRLLAESGPWFFAGAVLGAAVQTWIRTEWVERWIGRGKRSVVSASIAGAVLPGCALTTVPLASAFQAKGTPVGTLTAFIMIAPILSPHTIALTAAMLGAPITIARIVLPMALSIGLGLLLNFLQARRVRGFGGARSDAVLPAAACALDPCERHAGFWGNLRNVLISLSPYLIVALLAVALFQQLVPQQMLTRYMQGGWMAYAIAALAGIPLYVCEGAEVPLTLALLKLGIGIGPAFTFLLASVGTCIPTIAMAPRIIGWAATTAYVIAWLVLTIGGGLLVQVIF